MTGAVGLELREREPWICREKDRNDGKGRRRRVGGRMQKERERLESGRVEVRERERVEWRVEW